MNLYAVRSIYKYELSRWFRTLSQSILAPVISTSLYFVVFGSAIGSRMTAINGVSYGAFIVPGLMMLAVLTESLSNASFGIFMPKWNGTIYEVLTAPSDEPGWVRTLAASSEIVGRRKDGEVVPLELSMREMQQGDELSFTSIVRDISERKAAEQRVFRMAHHDALTELPNRNLFGDRVVEAFKRAKRHTEKLALLFVDLDKFKPINDTYGHAVGDEVLKAAANRLRFGVRATDTVARVGGDEFMVLLEELADAEEAEEIRQKLQTELCQPMRLSHHKVAIGASIGIAVYPDNGSEIAELMDYADQDMYARKHARGAEPTPRT